MFCARVTRRLYTSQTASTLTLSLSPRFTRLATWPVPMPPTPMTPMLMRSLAPITLAVARPANAMVPAEAALVLTKSRRENLGEDTYFLLVEKLTTRPGRNTERRLRRAILQQP